MWHISRWYYLKRADLLMLPSEDEWWCCSSDFIHKLYIHALHALDFMYTLSAFIIALTSLSIELISYHYNVPAEHLRIYILLLLKRIIMFMTKILLGILVMQPVLFFLIVLIFYYNIL